MALFSLMRLHRIRRASFFWSPVPVFFSPPNATVYTISFTSTGGVELTSVVGPLDGDIDTGRFVCCTILGNRFAYIFDSVMCIWDYEHNLFVRWGTSAPTGECQEIVFHGDRAWLLCNDVLMAWSIPELTTLEMYSSKPAEVLAPELTIVITRPPKSYETVLKHDNTSWVSSQDWYNNCGSPLASFDIIWTAIRVEKVTTYPLSSIYSPEHSTRPIQPTSTFAMPILGWDTILIPHVIDCIRRCRDFLIKPICSFRMTSLNLIVSPAWTSKAGDMESFRVVLPLQSNSARRGCLQEDENALFDVMHSQVFDPVAGRGCRINERDRRSVLVWDYLK
ncbi:hypothetical protein BJ165DRAFT_927944 [Panaeolus papilionaceus]|nr:hypothetical protein BJ165DRAFT_927944 [Panaeolus papilionaceus]